MTGRNYPLDNESKTMINDNPHCDGSGPHSGMEIRVLPISACPDHGNLLLCHACFLLELAYRRERNEELDPDCQYSLPRWEECKIYGSDR